jgi:mannosyltransferase OCH1-like enzyme
MIPKIIHQTNKNKSLPKLYQTSQRCIQNLHPDFEYKFWTDDDMYNLIKTYFPSYYDSFHCRA